MDRKVRIKDGDKCIHCHLCQKRCSFLTKYKADIGDTVKLRELAYHCFLCGMCSQVCPIGIDGRGIILDMRRTEVEENNGKCREKDMQCCWRKRKIISFGMSGICQAEVYCFQDAISRPFIRRLPGN